MFNKINLAIETPESIKINSTAIYRENAVVLAEQEHCLDYQSHYDPLPLMRHDKKIFYILFSGTKIKQDIVRNKTLITIEKSPASAVIPIVNFEINNISYTLNKVDNLLACDLLYAEGGIFDVNEIHAAVFFPYFMENRHYENKATLIFVNIMYERFKLIAKKIFESLNFKFLIDGSVIDLNTLTKKDFTRWITLHEYVHNSGPLSLFTSSANKFGTKEYGFVEEMRVDLTSIKLVFESLALVDKSFLNVVVIIFLERVFRGALYNYQPGSLVSAENMFAKEVEGDVSIALTMLLEKHGIIDFNKKIINVNQLELLSLINMLLTDIYKYEDLAAKKQAFNVTAHRFAKMLRHKVWAPTNQLIGFLNKYACQNCHYQIVFGV